MPSNGAILTAHANVCVPAPASVCAQSVAQPSASKPPAKRHKLARSSGRNHGGKALAAFATLAVTALRRGLLLAGLLALSAGFLGMHVTTGMHAAPPSTESLPAAESAGTTAGYGPAHREIDSPHPAGHTAPGAVAQPAANSGPLALSASCECQPGCTDLASMHSACIPAATAASLAAPPPGTAALSADSPAAPPAGSAASYSYLPVAPSPEELSISRT